MAQNIYSYITQVLYCFLLSEEFMRAASFYSKPQVEAVDKYIN